MVNPSILLVEDNSDEVELVRMAEQKMGAHADLVVARDGKAALDYLFAPETEAPAVVIVDLSLPGMGGLEVIRSIRSSPHTHRLPLVVLTASERDEDVIRSYDLGVNSFVRKPRGYDDFRALIAQLERYWVLTNLRPPV